MYYLNSRYYNPEIGCFINADDVRYLEPALLNGLNLYAYSGNNPVMYLDPNGNSFILVILLLGGSFLVGYGSSVVSQGISYGWDDINYWQAGVDGLFTLGSTALAATGVGLGLSIGLGASMGFGQYAIDSAFHEEKLTLAGSLISTSFGALGGLISGAGARNSSNIAKNMVGLSDDGVTAIRAITKAANRYAAGEISKRGFQGTLNLYAKTAFNSVQAATPGTMRMLFMNVARNIIIYTPISSLAQTGLNYACNNWGWI